MGAACAYLILGIHRWSRPIEMAQCGLQVLSRCDLHVQDALGSTDHEANRHIASTSCVAGDCLQLTQRSGMLDYTQP